MDEKQRFSFANFLHLFIQGPPLTHSGTETWIFRVEEDSDGDDCEGTVFEEEKDDEDEDTDIESEEEIEVVSELF